MDAGGGEALDELVAAAAAEEDKGRRGRGRWDCGGGGGGGDDDAVLMLRQPQEDSARAGVRVLHEEDDETAHAPAPRWKSCLRSIARCCLCWGWIGGVRRGVKGMMMGASLRRLKEGEEEDEEGRGNGGRASMPLFAFVCVCAHVFMGIWGHNLV